MARPRADIAALNHISTILIDARRLYMRAAHLAKEPEAVRRIEQTIAERSDLLNDIQERVTALGGKPQASGSGLGAAHVAFMNARAVLERDVNAAMAEVDRGEQYLRDEIRKCMRRDDLSMGTRAFLGVALDDAVSGEMRIHGARERHAPHAH